MKTPYNVPVRGEMKKAENPHTGLNNAVFKKKKKKKTQMCSGVSEKAETPAAISKKTLYY